MQNQAITKPGYRFVHHLGEIPEDWQVNNLVNLCDFYKGKGLSKEDLVQEGGLYECIHYGELFRGYGEKISNINFRTNYNDKPFFSGNNDVLMPTSDITPNGLATASSIKKEGVVLGGDILVIRLKENLDGEYFSFFVSGNKKQIMRLVSGTTVFHLYAKDMEKFTIAYPKDKLEQKKILKILNNINFQIEITKQIIQKIELRNKGLQLQLLNGKVRLPGFSEKWHTLELDECLNYSPRPVDKPSENFFALGVRSHGKGIFHKNDFDPEDIAIDTLYEVKEDDLIVNITFAWEQAIAIANKIDDGGLVSHRFPTYTFKLDKAIHRYFRYLIIQKRFKYMLDQISPGGAGRNRVLSKKDFLKLEVKIPKVEEQKAIADVLDKATEQLNEYKTKLEKLELQKKGLMQQLLTGKTRVKI